jgi:hypothetical protein
VKTERGWKRPFDEPIPLPRGRQLVTLEDAGNVMRALNRHAERVFEPSRKDKHWGKRKLKRDL